MLRPLSPRPHRASIVALLITGIVMLQIGWIFNVAAFGGLDEVDHAYRAASVAAGHLTDWQPAQDGRGDLVRVPASIVSAAHHQCSIRVYQKPQNCNPASAPDAAGNVLAATATARYNPIYYLVVGQVQRLAPHDGSLALHLMRAATALWCDLLLGAAALIVLRVAKTRLPFAAVLLITMPVLIGATTTVAPNGVQMSAGLLMWACLAPLALRRDLSRRTTSLLIITFSLAAALVVLTHATGPMWVLGSAVAAAAIAGIARIRDLWRESRRPLVFGAAAVTAVTLAAVAWTHYSGANSYSDTKHPFGAPTLVDFVGQPIAWLLQVVGCLPYRDEPAPGVAYLVAFPAFAAFIAMAWRRVSGRTRFILAGILASSLIVSLTFNFMAYASIGNAWQGRYLLAFAYGLPLLAAFAADHLPAARSTAWPVVAGVVAGFVNAATLINVRHLVGPKWTAADGLGQPSLALTVAAAVVGAVALAGAGWVAYRVAATQRSSTEAAEPSSIAAAARSMASPMRSSSEPSLTS